MSLLLNFIIYPKGTNFIPTWPLRPDLAYPCGRFGKGLNLPGNKAGHMRWKIEHVTKMAVLAQYVA